MILNSIQPASVVNILDSGKEFRCDGRKSYFLRACHFRSPYKWMVEQMRSKGFQKDNRYPVWAWSKYYEGSMRPPSFASQRVSFSSKRNFQKEKFFRLKLNVPDELVLLSDFYEWHCVLDNVFCGNDKYIIRMMTLEDNKTWPQERIDYLKRKSWQKIFDISTSTKIQACISKINPEWILKIDEIK